MKIKSRIALKSLTSGYTLDLTRDELEYICTFLCMTKLTKNTHFGNVAYGLVEKISTTLDVDDDELYEAYKRVFPIFEIELPDVVGMTYVPADQVSIQV